MTEKPLFGYSIVTRIEKNNNRMDEYKYTLRIINKGRVGWVCISEEMLLNATNEKGEDFVIRYQNMCAFYEGLGVLVREGKLNIRWVALLLSAPTRQMWEVTMPIMDEMREFTNVKRNMAEWEFLYNELMKYLEKHPELQS